MSVPGRRSGDRHGGYIWLGVPCGHGAGGYHGEGTARQRSRTIGKHQPQCRRKLNRAIMLRVITALQRVYAVVQWVGKGGATGEVEVRSEVGARLVFNTAAFSL